MIYLQFQATDKKKSFKHYPKLFKILGKMVVNIIGPLFLFTVIYLFLFHFFIALLVHLCGDGSEA